MNENSTRRETPAPLTELDASLTPDERRTCSVDRHQHFIRSISTDARGVDEIDRSLDDDLIDHGGQHQWEVSNSKKKAVAGLLSLLDQLAEDDSNREGQKL